MFFKKGKRESLLLSSRYYKINETDLDDYSARVFLIFVIPKDGTSTTPPVAIVWFFFIVSVVRMNHCFSMHRVAAVHSLISNSLLKRNHATVRVSQIEINTNLSKLIM